MVDYQDRKDIDKLLKTVDTLKYLINYDDNKAVATLEDLQALATRLDTMYYDKSEVYTKEEIDEMLNES